MTNISKDGKEYRLTGEAHPSESSQVRCQAFLDDKDPWDHDAIDADGEAFIIHFMFNKSDAGYTSGDPSEYDWENEDNIYDITEI